MTTKQKNRRTLPVDLAAENADVRSVTNAEWANPFPLGIYDSNHQVINLGEKIGGGGEGNVYHIQGHADLVAKIYHAQPSLEKAEKLIALSHLNHDRLSRIAAWPVDVLRDCPGGNVIGLVMKKIGQAAEVHTLHSPKSRLKKFPEASWAFLLHVATNIVRAVATIHEQGFVIGDVNPKNILVTRQATVYLLDCDSFQFSAGGKTYRCEGGFPEYTPSELQGIPFAAIDRTPEHDNFGLAVVIFQLLFLGRHPYSGRFLGAGEMPLEQAIRELRFAYGDDAAAREMHPPPGTLPLDTIPPALIALFRRAFLERDRPNPEEWLPALEQFSQSLQQCTLHSGHQFYDSLPHCPWCELEAKVGVRLFNLKLNQPRNTQFSLDSLWAEVDQLNKISTFPQKNKGKLPAPSAAVNNYTLVRDLRYRFGLAIAALAGLLIGAFSDLPVAFWFLFIIANLLRLFVKVGEGDSKKLEALLPKALCIANEDIAHNTSTRKREAENQLSQLQQQIWCDTHGELEYRDQIKALKAKCVDYDSLEKQRVAKLIQASKKAHSVARQQYLRKFAIKDSGLVKSNLAQWMEEKRITTAADLTEVRLQNNDVVNDYQKEQLLNWRKELENQFNFNPSAYVTPEVRIKIEQELDEHRQRLENEITAQTQAMKSLKQAVEMRAKQLTPWWNEAQNDLSQANRDIEEISKDNRLSPVVAVMVAAFLFVTMLEAFYVATPPKPPSQERVEAITDAQALDFHLNEGYQHYKFQRFLSARTSFENAVAIVNLDKWEHRYASLFATWGVCSLQMEQIDEVIKEIQPVLSYAPKDYKSRIKLLVLSGLKRDLPETVKQYHLLMQTYPRVAQSLKMELIAHGINLETIDAQTP